MAHVRKPLAIAVALNFAIFAVEAVGGFQSQSLSLVMDSIHNLSDQLALVFLYLAFRLRHGVSKHLLRSANLLNSVGLLAVSGLLLWQVATRLAHPAPVLGTVPILVGLAAALANWGVARLLRDPGRDNASIRLAYVHNLGDVWVSLAPVAAGVLVSTTGLSRFDPVVAGCVAVWFIVSTGREVVESHEDLIWPEKIMCGHAGTGEPSLKAPEVVDFAPLS
jgi:cobalt-zinc-cadmium efflux system protein